MDDGTRDVRPGRSTTTQPYEEEFLFHLSRGSEFLVENHVERAKEELERALRYQPHDAKGQDLLASVYFRLGVYPRAIEIWTRLSRAHPSDLPLRVNLGLVLLKTGQPEEARANFLRATEIDPKHARAYRYLGLAQWRCGELDRARESFLRGGEVTMARRMEEMLGETSEPVIATTMAEETASAERAEVRSAATDALERFATNTEPLEVEPSHGAAPAGTWTVVEQGRESTPRTTHARGEARGDVETLARRLGAWSVPAEGGPRLSVAANGFLVLATEEPVSFRNAGLRAARGPVRIEPLARRGRTESESTRLASGAFVHAPSGIRAFVAPPEGQRFVAITLLDDGVFVVESNLEAFDGALAHESARVGADIDVVSLRGTGTVVLRVRAEPSALEVGSGTIAHVAPSALVGWSGRLFPVEDAEALVSGMLAFRGEGTLLVL